MFCPKCGAENLDKAQFCKTCGKLFPEKPTGIAEVKQEQQPVAEQPQAVAKQNVVQKVSQRPDALKPLLGMYHRWQSAFVVAIIILFLFAGISTWNWFHYKGRSEQLSNENSRLTSDLSAARSQLSSTEQQLEDTKDRLLTKENDLATTQSQLTAREGELSRSEEDLAQAQDTADLYKGQVEGLSQELKDSDATLQACFSDVYYSQNYSYVKSSPLGFKLLCADECNLDGGKLEEIFFDFQHAVLSVEEALAIDIKDYYRSVEVHARPDGVCSSIGSCAYATSLGYSSGLPRGLICFDAPGCESSASVFIHELLHQLWHKQEIPSSTNEGFSNLLMVILGWQYEVGPSSSIPESFCDPMFDISEEQAKRSLYSKGERLWHELCQRHGFDIDDLPAFFDLAEQQPDYHTEGLSFETYIGFISQITGEDVKPTFDEILSIPLDNTVCGNGECERDEWYYCSGDCS